MSLPPKLFTVEEANALLPEIRRHLSTLQGAAALMEARAPRRDARSWLVANPGGTAVSATFFAALLEFAAAASLAATGALLKDVKQGLVDFPARIEGREVLLCWREGEERVRHWHDSASGFAGRRPLGEE